jgi:hypothetical protein
MLEHAVQALAHRQIDYLFLGTHSQSGHDLILAGLQQLDYRVEVSSPFEDATAWDGFILATSPWVAPVLTKPWTPWGIEATRQATPQTRIAYLYETLEAFGLLA